MRVVVWGRCGVGSGGVGKLLLGRVAFWVSRVEEELP